MTRWSRNTRAPAVQLDLDLRKVETVMTELKSTEAEIGKATTRALRRTEGALMKMARMRLKSELEVKNLAELRRRLKSFRIRTKSKPTEQVIGLWFALDPMGVSRFKYKPRPKAVEGGATFNGHTFGGAFLARARKDARQSIYRRSSRGRFPIVEEKIDISAVADPIIEDEIFPRATEIFLKNLRHELRYQFSQRGKVP